MAFGLGDLRSINHNVLLCLVMWSLYRYGCYITHAKQPCTVTRVYAVVLMLAMFIDTLWVDEL